jgi:hypothetical protein
LTEVTLKHIYRERNRLADELSKGGFWLAPGRLLVS